MPSPFLRRETGEIINEASLSPFPYGERMQAGR